MASAISVTVMEVEISSFSASGECGDPECTCNDNAEDREDDPCREFFLWFLFLVLRFIQKIDLFHKFCICTV